ncbi:LuxR C-terminal-related transcriptional regulator [Chloroflexota bacterium]
MTHCYCAAARIKLAFGETNRAIEYLQSATQAAQASPLMHFQIRNLACQVNLALHLNDIETALQWAAGENCELPEKLPSHLHEVRQISLARVYFAQGDLEKTMQTLDRIQSQAESAGRMAHVIDINLLKARGLQEQNKSTAAIECLESALSLAAPEGYIQTFVDYGKPMKHLLRRLAEDGADPIYVNKLLSAFDAKYQPESSVQTEILEDFGSTAVSTPLEEPLTDRELEVLRLMAEGLTYREIANQIIVSLNTVRTHVKNIYSKLDAHKRSQAIATARELKIL